MNNASNTWIQANRLGGLRRFSIAISVLNILGHTVLGFEQSWATPLVSLATAYGMELLLEWIDARLAGRRPAYLGSVGTFVDFLLSAHISGLAVAMLLYANERLWPVALAAAATIGSKAVFRVGRRHFFNPSNFGITLTLLLFPWVGIAPPYQFTENIDNPGDWIMPGIIILSGSFLNWRFTKRLPLIAAWLSTFALQAFVRSTIFGTPAAAAWLPMTGVAFILYTFYMVTDPATTPNSTRGQILFGASVAVTYCVLMVVHVVFGLFFALTIVCALRGGGLWIEARLAPKRKAAAPLEVEAVAGLKA